MGSSGGWEGGKKGGGVRARSDSVIVLWERERERWEARERQIAIDAARVSAACPEKLGRTRPAAGTTMHGGNNNEIGVGGRGGAASGR
jgi:hypothetical protein